MYLYSVTTEEICYELLQLISKNSRLLNDILIFLGKSSVNILSFPLCQLINQSILRRCLPLVPQTIQNHSCSQKGDKTKTENYRHITITHSLSKLIESLFKKVGMFYTIYALNRLFSIWI